MQRGRKIFVGIRPEGSRWSDGSCYNHLPVLCLHTYIERFEHSEELMNGVVTYVQEFSSSLPHPVI